MAKLDRPAADMREMTDQEIVQAITEAQRELFTLRMRHATRQITSPFQMRKLKRDIARFKTIQTERRLGITRG